MNVEKLFKALEEDQDNHAMGIICAELEEQGYSIKLDDVEVTAQMFFEETAADTLSEASEVVAEISKSGEEPQSFRIKFADFHEITISKK